MAGQPLDSRWADYMPSLIANWLLLHTIIMCAFGAHARTQTQTYTIMYRVKVNQ